MTLREQPTFQNVFAREIGYFTLPDVREFVEHVFGELCPQYFWYIRASQRGHHHPLMRTYGGLVHHVKLAFRFANEFTQMHTHAMNERTYNQILAAVLLHDMMKRGAERDELVTFGNHKIAARSHGRYCADEIKTHIFDGKIEIEWLPIVEAVRLHMGRWTHEVTDDELRLLDNDPVIRYTHLADYAASRSLHKWIGERYTDESMRYLQ